MYVCAACHAREEEPPSSRPPAPLARFECCDKALCSACLPPAITAKLELNLWFDLDLNAWLACPFRGCEGTLSIANATELAALYDSVGALGANFHVQIFTRACAIRTKLREVVEQLPWEAARTAYDLHHRLFRYRAMSHVFFDLHSDDELEVDFLSVLSSDGEIVRVPILTSLFNRESSTTRTCLVCAEELRDVSFPFPSGWKRLAGRDFQGDLHLFGEPFPRAEALPVCAGAHELDICKGCIARHVHAKLEERGSAAVNELRCPAPGCGHLYTPQELRAVTNHETYSRYERLCLINALQNEPDFRWCLRPGCRSGQMYDTTSGCCEPPALSGAAALGERAARALPDDVRDPNRITCDTCGFAMCFEHQAPWHRGMTCREYSDLLARGDGAAETESWMKRNTKKCPGKGCGVAVEKGGGCFHMRCGSCGAEFCWECLADWKGIWTRAGYNLKGHRKGCFFRSKDAPRPLFMRGDTMEEAVEMHEKRAGRDMRGGQG
ncbi:uncharacterized protein DNG_07471 [Cephalotrichum gorgonifer]|uniref:RBR-type E3 ubiquitin transferase n=1 Tax=Cephalotrichum gorgonifer TaxID=2041049 RepID=A0AAE8SXF7_9PEZI|nr:uncharacterized protein DNG_07471 [Cephalotrichum gorgonifer]